MERGGGAAPQRIHLFGSATDDRYWKNVSPEAKDFVRSCLLVDPSKRITADEAMNHKASPVL
jgi:serine/threonine protein kinase